MNYPCLVLTSYIHSYYYYYIGLASILYILSCLDISIFTFATACRFDAKMLNFILLYWYPLCAITLKLNVI